MKFLIPKKEIKKIEEIILYGTNKTENISFNLNDLIYISSQGNYASFFIKTGSETKEIILRNTLSAIIKELNKYNNIIRCHKSYIINTNYVNAISGNARGYYLRSNSITQQIPVSRSFNKSDLQKMVI
ncbi:LytR/AlgR family response regulator transcription factor [Polaribacter ponticola]|uniref:LytTR family DNA-binding domain-containing protein n=1 Tax=Polaribacter ponticola TaxID=2978475 RepID=A0ABT5SE49_9FLAO|nr:LytTR family DNA-binding domain-containing protein [Polaribacter sp. MSW5]MDD7915542.1 LytTR family DNA-binding domain-containing protein [Polaribacter sp. MSW5]